MAGKTFEAKAPSVVKPVANGSYSGRIVKHRATDPKDASSIIYYRNDPYEYADVEIKIDGLTDTSIVFSLPCKELTPINTFGRFLALFQPFKVGDPINPDLILNNQEVTFMVMNQPGKNDPMTMYPKVIKDSVFPKGYGQAAYGPQSRVVSQ